VQLHGFLQGLQAPFQVGLIPDLALVVKDLLPSLCQDVLNLLIVDLPQRLDGIFMLVVFRIEGIDYL